MIMLFFCLICACCEPNFWDISDMFVWCCAHKAVQTIDLFQNLWWNNWFFIKTLGFEWILCLYFQVMFPSSMHVKEIKLGIDLSILGTGAHKYFFSYTPFQKPYLHITCIFVLFVFEKYNNFCCTLMIRYRVQFPFFWNLKISKIFKIKSGSLKYSNETSITYGY